MSEEDSSGDYEIIPSVPEGEMTLKEEDDKLIISIYNPVKRFLSNQHWRNLMLSHANNGKNLEVVVEYPDDRCIELSYNGKTNEWQLMHEQSIKLVGGLNTVRYSWRKVNLYDIRLF